MKSNTLKRLSSALLSACLLTTGVGAGIAAPDRVSAQAPSAAVSDNTDYVDRMVNGFKILNREDVQSWSNAYADDRDDITAFKWFYDVQWGGQTIPGVSVSYADLGGDDGKFRPNSIDSVNGHFIGRIKVADIPELRRLAEGGSARFALKVGILNSSTSRGAYIWAYTDKQYRTGDVLGEHGGTAQIGWANSPSKWNRGITSDDDDIRNDSVRSPWLSFGVDDYIVIETETNGASTTVEEIRLYFADIELPGFKPEYTFTSNGTERSITYEKDGQPVTERQLFLKSNEQLQLKYEFTKPLRAEAQGQVAQMSSHDLFVNPAGTGMPRNGEKESIKLPNGGSTLIDNGGIPAYSRELLYSYTGNPYNHTGNNPIFNNAELTNEDRQPGDALNENSLWAKIDAAEFHDAAGNPLQMGGFGLRAGADSTDHLKGRSVNPFDLSQGYRVIVDAVPPKYTSQANGIQPEILTGSTLNGGDSIDFTVRFTEDVIPAYGWPAEGMFLKLNNGMKARYVSGSGSKTWTFRADIAGDDPDVSLLKVIALTHELKLDDTDKDVIQDYAGNLLTDSAYADKRDSGDESQAVPYTKINWAQLAVDNTDPVIGYRYEAGGATDTIYKRTGKIAIDANDPPVIAPELDPDEPGNERPSRGIYRPLNMTGGSAGQSDVGLVYYYWSNSGDNPLEGKEGDNFAALKRYSLTGEQPREVLYPGELENFNLTFTNNKTNSLLPPAEAFSADNSGLWYLHTWTADMTWETARELMQYGKMKGFEADYPDVYNGWIGEYLAANPQGSNADARKYADDNVLLAVGQYADEQLWKPEDFKRDDSNWVYAKAAIALDNKPPVAVAGATSGNNTSEVTVQLELSDEHSGLDALRLLYQWVKPGDPVTEIGWTAMAGDHVVSTLNQVIEDGEYELHVRIFDQAGNRTQIQKEDRVVVNSEVNVQAAFSPEPAEGRYVQSHDIEFGVTGIETESVVYTFSPSPARPLPEAYRLADVSSAVYGAGVTDYVYAIPADASLNGLQYLHVRVKEQDRDRYYYYQKAYLFDNAAPQIGYSLTDVAYPKRSHTVVVTASDLYNEAGMIVRYQWLRTGEAAPEPGSAGWLELPAGGGATIDNSRLAAGEAADFTLHVWAEDGAGNGTLSQTGPFMVSREQGGPVEVSEADLLYITGDKNAGYYAIVKLELRGQSKEGIEYAMSADDGLTWNAWLPYSNFAKVKVPDGKPQGLKLKVKFRSAVGSESGAAAVETSRYSRVEPVYGIAVHHTLKPVKADGRVELAISVPAGIKVIPAAGGVNPMVPVRLTGNTFEVTQNGLYTFELTDTADAARAAKLLVAVNNFDLEAPRGSIEYSIVQPTAANVRVKLDTSEPVRITNNDGRATYAFTDNGTFTFYFEDEAGNTGSVTASVNNINRSAPHAVIAESYAYGPNGSKAYKTVTDEQGQVVLRQGVTLSLQKENPGDGDFAVIRGEKVQSFTQNGTASFTIADKLSNKAVLEQEVTGIVSSLPEPDSIVYTFVDENGVEIPEDEIALIDGKRYARGRVKATIAGAVEAPNRAFSGTVPVLAGSGSNQISDDSGQYRSESFYSANGRKTVAIADLLGNIRKVPLIIEGLDNTAPTIELNVPYAAVVKDKADFDPAADLGGYIVADNLSQAADIRVTLSGLNLSQLGTQIVTYTAADQAGNTVSVTQKVVVIAEGGMLIAGNGQIISSQLGESVIFDRNDITFAVTGYNEMVVEGESLINERGTFDILYQSGRYREGQMKYIARQVTMEQLLHNEFKVVFPRTGWYTVIVRTQEREREFTTFFVGNMTVPPQAGAGNTSSTSGAKE